jgi:hypothetical protein
MPANGCCRPAATGVIAARRSWWLDHPRAESRGSVDCATLVSGVLDARDRAAALEPTFSDTPTSDAPVRATKSSQREDRPLRSRVSFRWSHSSCGSADELAGCEAPGGCWSSRHRSTPRRGLVTWSEHRAAIPFRPPRDADARRVRFVIVRVGGRDTSDFAHTVSCSVTRSPLLGNGAAGGAAPESSSNAARAPNDAVVRLTDSLRT